MDGVIVSGSGMLPCIILNIDALVNLLMIIDGVLPEILRTFPMYFLKVLVICVLRGWLTWCPLGMRNFSSGVSQAQ